MRVLKWMFFLGLVVAGVAAFYLVVPFGPAQETFVDIAPGTGTAGIAAQLEKAGIVRSRYVFDAVRLVKEFSGHGGTLKAGEYKFDQPGSVLGVYDRIRRGDVYTIALVVPEGYNLFDIANAVQAAGLGSRDEFLKAARLNVDLIQQWSPHAASLEGYLFPDTYKFDRHTTPGVMLATMVHRFGQEAQRLGLNGTDVSRTVTVASLVEKEVRFDDERAEVASVFENRLAAGMPLQTDPAVIYASLLRGTWTGVIHESELHSDSAYNTYAHKGLPPGPICNPGLAAFKAAMHPAQTDYLYFVADAGGRTKFAKSLGEHNANVADYRRSQQ